MSTCHSEICKTGKGEAVYLNLFSADSALIKVNGVEPIKETFKKLANKPLMLSTDIGELSLGNVTEARVGCWGRNSEGEVRYVTCCVTYEPNALSDYLMNNDVRIAGSVLFAPHGIRLVAHIDKTANIRKTYTLAKFLESNHATRK